MRRPQVISIAAGLILLISASACGVDESIPKSAAGEASPEATTVAAPEPKHQDFDSGSFDNPTVIDNEWMPMRPGMQWVFDGYTTEEDEKIPHRIEFTITDLTKEIEGVRTVVAWIVDISDGEVVEKEIAFYAQDNDGNVWYFGEHPEEYEGGKFVKASTWIAGCEDARPGVKMWANPTREIPPYFQGWGPAVGWSDYAQIDKGLNQACVPAGCYEGILVIAETSLGETDIYQLKHYARGVGEIRTGWRGEPKTPEGLRLAEQVQLSQEALAAVRADALALEEHAYKISVGVLDQTVPSEVEHASGG